MIKNKTVIFGYGTVGVSSKQGVLSLSWIKPPQEVGSDITNVEGLEYIQTVKFDYDDDMYKLLSNLDGVDETNCQIIFRDYILDFSNYNMDSIKMVKKHVRRVIDAILPLLAC